MPLSPRSQAIMDKSKILDKSKTLDPSTPSKTLNASKTLEPSKTIDETSPGGVFHEISHLLTDEGVKAECQKILEQIK